jgi:hypothetical protein
MAVKNYDKWNFFPASVVQGAGAGGGIIANGWETTAKYPLKGAELNDVIFHLAEFARESMTSKEFIEGLGETYDPNNQPTQLNELLDKVSKASSGYPSNGTPTATDDNTKGYKTGDVWIDKSTTPRKAYVLLNDAGGGAVWKEIAKDSTAPSDASTTVKGIIEIATQAEVDAGTDNTKAVTPKTLPSGAGSASTTAKGVIEIATQAEVDAGTDTVRAVTPKTLAGSKIVGLKAGVPISTDFKGKTKVIIDTTTGVGYSLRNDGVVVKLNNAEHAGAPTVSDDNATGYRMSDIWIDTSATPREIYMLTDDTNGAAVWQKLSATSAYATIKVGTGLGATFTLAGTARKQLQYTVLESRPDFDLNADGTVTVKRSGRYLVSSIGSNAATSTGAIYLYHAVDCSDLADVATCSGNLGSFVLQVGAEVSKTRIVELSAGGKIDCSVYNPGTSNTDYQLWELECRVELIMLKEF